MDDSLEAIMLKRQIEDMRRSFSMLKNQIRNVIADLEENEDPEEAVTALKNLIGDE